MSTTTSIEPDPIDSPEQCISRISAKLAEVEVAMVLNEGRTNQMRKERDAEKATNEKLRRQVAKLTNDLLRERMEGAKKEEEIREQQDQVDGTLFASRINASDMRGLDRRRISLPAASMWGQKERRGSQQDHPKDVKKLLDRRSNELLQQRQQYRIFESRFQHEADRCSKLARDLPPLQHLLEGLLKLHGRHRDSSGVWCHGDGNGAFKANTEAAVALGERKKRGSAVMIVFLVSALVSVSALVHVLLLYI